MRQVRANRRGRAPPPPRPPRASTRGAGSPCGSRAGAARAALPAPAPWCGRPGRRAAPRGEPEQRRAVSGGLPDGELRLPLWHHREYDAMGAAQERARGALDVGRRHLAIAVEVLLEVVRRAGVVVVEV